MGDACGTALAHPSFTMSTIIIVYDTKYGQTRRIAEHIGDFVRSRGHNADVARVDPSHALDVAALDVADAIVVLAPVFVGKHPKSIQRFIALHHVRLNRRKSAFFSVSGSAGSTIPDERKRAQDAATAFVASTPWRPQSVVAVGGAIDYPRYNPFLRLVLKFISKKNGGPTDTSRKHELTDWNAVERATLALLATFESGQKVASVETAVLGVAT
jgi:menaquinone-dependent protoporphyrinogen oxidase